MFTVPLFLELAYQQQMSVRWHFNQSLHISLNRPYNSSGQHWQNSGLVLLEFDYGPFPVSWGIFSCLTLGGQLAVIEARFSSHMHRALFAKIIWTVSNGISNKIVWVHYLLFSKALRISNRLNNINASFVILETIVLVWMQLVYWS